jgi:hypothetical protein
MYACWHKCTQTWKNACMLDTDMDFFMHDPGEGGGASIKLDIWGHVGSKLQIRISRRIRTHRSVLTYETGEQVGLLLKKQRWNISWRYPMKSTVQYIYTTVCIFCIYYLRPPRRYNQIRPNFGHFDWKNARPKPSLKSNLATGLVEYRETMSFWCIPEPSFLYF